MSKKSTIIGIRCTKKEREQMKRNAHLQFKSLSEYVRDLALKNE